MRRRLSWTVGIVVVLVGACGDDDDVVERDTGVNRGDGGIELGPPGVDMGTEDAEPPPPPPDLGPPPDDVGPPDVGPPDMGPSEPCDRPGTSEDLVCGMCGTQSRFCTSARVWEYSACEGEHGICIAGTRGVEACGRCGTAEARCTAECRWEITGDCEGEMGECDPGAVERTAMGCPAGSTRGRACNAMCGWGDYTDCRARPTDFDGDGSPYGTDCDDRDPTVEPGSTVACGRFACGSVAGSVAYLPGTRSCTGPGWTICERPAGCTEPTGTTLCDIEPFAMETRDCASTGCPMEPMQQTRSCMPPPAGGASTWGPWGECFPIFFGGMCTFAASDVVEETCGACGEGVRYTVCDGSTCMPSSTSCLGRGCTPGTSVLSTSGCPMGQVRAQTCMDDCRLGPPGACEAGPTMVDVMLLFDVSGSHGGALGAVRGALEAAVVDPLLADGLSAIGVSYFSDYPFGSHGSAPDVPFGGVTEPVTEPASATDALGRVMLLAGGDQGEALVEALNILSGGSPHPSAMPLLECSAGRTAGGCWRAGTRPVIVVFTEEGHHALPQADMLGITPYMGVTPAPPAWDAVRDQLAALGATVLFVKPRTSFGTSPLPQFEAIAAELGQDPAASIVEYDEAAPDDGLAALLDALRTLAP